MRCLRTDPVPSFVTGEQWEFGGTWEGAIWRNGLYPAAAEADLCLKGFHLFQIVAPLLVQKLADKLYGGRRANDSS